MRTRVVSSTSGSAEPIVRKHRPDYLVALFMAMLMLIGLVVMYAIGPQRANVLNNSFGTSFYTSTYFFIKQAGSILLAIVAFVLFSLLPTTYVKKYASKVLWLGFGLCMLLFVAGNLLKLYSIAQCTLGACRWFELGPLGSVQPAEFLKFGFLIYLAGFLSMRIAQNKLGDREKTLIPVGVLYILAMLFVVVLQKDMGTGIALTGIVASMFVVGGLSLRQIGSIAGILLALGVLLIVIAPHRINRITTFVGGSSGSSGKITDANYQIENAKIAIGSGGLLGLGIGNSVQATGYLPEAINDSVFAIMGEIFGFVGLVCVIGLFAILLTRLLRIGNHLPDMWARLIAAGVFGWLGSHVVLNIAAMIGVFPLTGITLPLLSFGGTSMIFIAAALGLVFQLSKYTSHSNLTKESNSYENLSSRRGIGRSRYASSHSR